eukprot:4328751-Pyramimonas_sp.AAC.1
MPATQPGNGPPRQLSCGAGGSRGVPPPSASRDSVALVPPVGARGRRGQPAAGGPGVRGRA